MGMTLWIHTLEDREYSKDSDDHSMMHTHADALDALCDAANVRKLSDFFDFTGLEAGFVDDDDDGDGPDIDEETGYAWGIDDMQWFASDEGLVTLHRLRDDIAAGVMEDLDDDDTDALLEELDDCIAILEDTAARGGKFHLSVVE
jgi:hypothetical protein